MQQNNEWVRAYLIPQSWGHTCEGNGYWTHPLLAEWKGEKNPFTWYSDPVVQNAMPPNLWFNMIHDVAQRNHLTVPQFVTFVNWCESNKRSVRHKKSDRRTPSIDLWIADLSKDNPGEALFISLARKTGKTTDELLAKS